MSRMNVSLVCTVFNEADNIESFLNSIFAMSRLPDEVIIVDGGSADGTAGVIQRFAANHPTVKLIVEPGANIARGRNVAVEHARYESIAFSDAGCKLDVHWLERIAAPMEEDQPADVVGGWSEMDPATAFERWLSLLQRPFEKLDPRTYLPSARSLALKKECWKAVGGFPEHLTRWGEDTAFLRKLKDRGFRFILVPDALVYWRPRRTMKDFWIQQHQYGRGDGEARLYTLFNVKRTVFVLSPWLLILGIFFSPGLSLLSFGILVFGFFRIVVPFRPRGVPRWKVVPMLALVMISETAQLTGYVRGRVRRAPGPREEHVVMCMFSGLESVPPVVNEGMSLADRGYDVRLLGIRYTRAQSAGEDLAPRLRLTRMTILSRRILGDGDAFEGIRYAEVAFRSFFWSLFRKVDLYVAHDLVVLPFLYVAARLRGKPIVYRAHELWPEQSNNYPRARLWSRLDRFFSRRVDLIVTPEVNRARVYLEEYAAPRMPTVIFNCSRLRERPQRSTLKPRMVERGIGARFIVYYQGGISSLRATDKLVESMRYTSDDVALALAGPMHEQFAAWFPDFVAQHQLQDRILHLGDIPHGEQLFELCSGANVGVAFAKGDCRNNLFSATATNKLFEYMMMGIPLLTLDYPSYRDLIEKEEIGICVDSENPESIAAGIMKMYGDPAHAVEMGIRARKLAEEKFNWEKEFPRLLQEYENLLERK